MLPLRLHVDCLPLVPLPLHCCCRWQFTVIASSWASREYHYQPVTDVNSPSGHHTAVVTSLVSATVIPACICFQTASSQDRRLRPSRPRDLVRAICHAKQKSGIFGPIFLSRQLKMGTVLS
jgi:hypothetical protein